MNDTTNTNFKPDVSAQPLKWQAEREAHKRGEKIEHRSNYVGQPKGEWRDCPSPLWSDDPRDEYRIAPSPQLHWKQRAEKAEAKLERADALLSETQAELVEKEARCRELGADLFAQETLHSNFNHLIHESLSKAGAPTHHPDIGAPARKPMMPQERIEAIRSFYDEKCQEASSLRQQLTAAEAEKDKALADVAELRKQLAAKSWVETVRSELQEFVDICSDCGGKGGHTYTSDPQGGVHDCHRCTPVRDVLKMIPPLPTPAPSPAWKPRFKVGDRVKVRSINHIGTVYGSCLESGAIYYEVSGNPHPLRANEAELEPYVWSLPPPPFGEWHRTDGWKEEWLKDGWRPLLNGEQTEIGDEHLTYPWDCWRRASDGYISDKFPDSHLRTRRPLPPAPEERVPWTSTHDIPQYGSVWIRSKGDYREHLIIGLAHPVAFITASCGCKPCLQDNHVSDWNMKDCEWSMDRQTWQPCSKPAREEMV